VFKIATYHLLSLVFKNPTIFIVFEIKYPFPGEDVGIFIVINILESVALFLYDFR
jgi:hypothetical protein